MTEPKHQSRDPGILSTLATTTKQTITKFERAAKSSTELLKPAESAMETAVQARSSSIAVDGFSCTAACCHPPFHCGWSFVSPWGDFFEPTRFSIQTRKGERPFLRTACSNLAMKLLKQHPSAQKGYVGEYAGFIRVIGSA